MHMTDAKFETCLKWAMENVKCKDEWRKGVFSDVKNVTWTAPVVAHIIGMIKVLKIVYYRREKWQGLGHGVVRFC